MIKATIKLINQLKLSPRTVAFRLDQHQRRAASVPVSAGPTATAEELKREAVPAAEQKRGPAAEQKNLVWVDKERPAFIAQEAAVLAVCRQFEAAVGRYTELGHNKHIKGQMKSQLHPSECADELIDALYSYLAGADGTVDNPAFKEHPELPHLPLLLASLRESLTDRVASQLQDNRQREVEDRSGNFIAEYDGWHEKYWAQLDLPTRFSYGHGVDGNQDLIQLIQKAAARSRGNKLGAIAGEFATTVPEEKLNDVELLTRHFSILDRLLYIVKFQYPLMDNTYVHGDLFFEELFVALEKANRVKLAAFSEMLSELLKNDAQCRAVFSPEELCLVKIIADVVFQCVMGKNIIALCCAWQDDPNGALTPENKAFLFNCPNEFIRKVLVVARPESHAAAAGAAPARKPKKKTKTLMLPEPQTFINQFKADGRIQAIRDVLQRMADYRARGESKEDDIEADIAFVKEKLTLWVRAYCGSLEQVGRQWEEDVAALLNAHPEQAIRVIVLQNFLAISCDLSSDSALRGMKEIFMQPLVMTLPLLQRAEPILQKFRPGGECARKLDEGQRLSILEEDELQVFMAANVGALGRDFNDNVLLDLMCQFDARKNYLAGVETQCAVLADFVVKSHSRREANKDNADYQALERELTALTQALEQAKRQCREIHSFNEHHPIVNVKERLDPICQRITAQQGAARAMAAAGDPAVAAAAAAPEAAAVSVAAAVAAALPAAASEVPATSVPVERISAPTDREKASAQSRYSEESQRRYEVEEQRKRHTRYAIGLVVLGILAAVYTGGISMLLAAPAVSFAFNRATEEFKLNAVVMMGKIVLPLMMLAFVGFLIFSAVATGGLAVLPWIGAGFFWELGIAGGVSLLGLFACYGANCLAEEPRGTVQGVVLVASLVLGGIAGGVVGMLTGVLPALLAVAAVVGIVVVPSYLMYKRCCGRDVSVVSHKSISDLTSEPSLDQQDRADGDASMQVRVAVARGEVHSAEASAAAVQGRKASVELDNAPRSNRQLDAEVSAAPA